VNPDPLARIRAAVEEMERRSRATAERDAARGTEIADAARRGDLGPQWRTVQQRVDRGETSLDDVFSGRDSSPEAVALARRSRENLSRMSEVVQADDDVRDARAELADARARVTGTVSPARRGDGPEPPLPDSVRWDPRS
jgi:hypothetical protein